MKILKIIISIACAAVLMPANAQTCKTATIVESTPTSQFTMKGSTVTDNLTGLSWMRCAVGQNWDGKTCSGSANTLTWDEAVNAVVKLNKSESGGHSDWRLPLIPELASIVERQCFEPRINKEIFPQTPSQMFWSGMEKMGSQTQAYSLDFGGGDAIPNQKNIKGHIRLVRGGPWWTPPSMVSN